MKTARISGISWIMAVATGALGVAAWGEPPSLPIERLGFFDADHSRASDNMSQSSLIIGTTDTRWVMGVSSRYSGFGNDGGLSAWVYHPSAGTRRVGLFDVDHVRSDGYQFTSPSYLSPSGVAAGWSYKYRGQAQAGDSVWVYLPWLDQTIDVTMRDALHTEGGGYQSSAVRGLNNAGTVLGSSIQYDGWTQAGRTAWMYNHATGREILGLKDAEHTGAGGYRSSLSSRLNQAGVAAGTSTRYTGAGASLGQSAWVHTPGAGSVRVGLYDADHTSASGLISNQVRGLSELGTVLGTAPRYRGGVSAANESVWHADANGNTLRIGLHDAEHTSTDGTQQSEAFAMTGTGFAAGRSRRFGGATVNGWSAWVYRPDAGHRRVGLTDAEHTRLNGSRISEFAAINGAGQVVGTSNRYTSSPNTQVGVSAFFDDPLAGSVRIGMADAEHTRSDSFREVANLGLTEGGLASGRSRRYAGTDQRGWTAWVYRSDIGTRRLGLTGGVFTHADGWQESVITLTNDAGFVIGTSLRYGDFGVQTAHHGWFHDLNADATYDLSFASTSDGYTWTRPSLVTGSGVVFGEYRPFAPDDTWLGLRAFVWSVVDGFRDLGELVAGGLPAEGLSGLRDVAVGQDYEFIVGYAALVGRGGSGVYALVPAPGGGVLPGGVVWLVRRRRR